MGCWHTMSLELNSLQEMANLMVDDAWCSPRKFLKAATQYLCIRYSSGLRIQNRLADEALEGFKFQYCRKKSILKSNTTQYYTMLYNTISITQCYQRARGYVLYCGISHQQKLKYYKALHVASPDLKAFE